MSTANSQQEGTKPAQLANKAATNVTIGSTQRPQMGAYAPTDLSHSACAAEMSIRTFRDRVASSSARITSALLARDLRDSFDST